MCELSSIDDKIKLVKDAYRIFNINIMIIQKLQKESQLTDYIIAVLDIFFFSRELFGYYYGAMLMNFRLYSVSRVLVNKQSWKIV